jgi:hypothetical protein
VANRLAAIQNSRRIQHSSASVRTTPSVRPAMGFLSKTQIWEDGCNRLDDVDSHPNGLIHKASIAFKIQTSEHQSSWSGRTSYLYGNRMHLINHPDEWRLDMEIAYSWSAIVRIIGQHRSDEAQIRKELQRNFGKPIAQLPVRTPYVYCPDDA